MKSIVISPQQIVTIPNVQVKFPEGINVTDIIQGDLGRTETGFIVYRKATLASVDVLSEYFPKPIGFFTGKLCGTPKYVKNNEFLKIGLSVYDKPNSLYINCLISGKTREIIQQYVLPSLTETYKPPISLAGKLGFSYNDVAKRTEVTLFVSDVSLIPRDNKVSATVAAPPKSSFALPTTSYTPVSFNPVGAAAVDSALIPF